MSLKHTQTRGCRVSLDRKSLMYVQGYRKRWTGFETAILKKYWTDLHVLRLKMFRKVQSFRLTLVNL